MVASRFDLLVEGIKSRIEIVELRTERLKLSLTLISVSRGASAHTAPGFTQKRRTRSRRHIAATLCWAALIAGRVVLCRQEIE